MRGQSGYITLAFLRVPNTRRGNKIKKGFFNPTVSGPTCGQSGYITLAVSVTNAARLCAPQFFDILIWRVWSMQSCALSMHSIRLRIACKFGYFTVE